MIANGQTSLIQIWQPEVQIDSTILQAAETLDISVLKSAYANTDTLASKPLIAVTILSHPEITDTVISFIREAISMGADCNSPITLNKMNVKGRCDFTPLLSAVRGFGNVMKLVNLLVDNGADIDYTNRFGETAASLALSYKWNLDVAHWLITKQRAKVPFTVLSSNPSAKKKETIQRLLSMFFPLDSYEYKLKMEIVSELEKRGFDYWKCKDPELIRNYIHYTVFEIVRQRINPPDWEEYFQRY